MQDVALVKSLIQRHLKYTTSSLAAKLLADWPNTQKNFVKVYPHEYARAIAEAAASKVGPGFRIDRQ